MARRAVARRAVAAVFSILLVASAVFTLLDTFVFEQRLAVVASGVSSALGASSESADASADASGDTSAGAPGSASAEASAETSVSVSSQRLDDTTVYVADIQLAEGDTIQAALADNTYGRNVTDTTSNIADSVGARLAINGDFYGARESGFVVRNGEVLRDVSAGDDQQDMVVWSDASMSVISEGDWTAEDLVAAGAVQVLSFGPALVVDSAVVVDAGDEVDQAMTSNPRTAVGYLGDGHYVFVVADGRTEESAGLSLVELADFLQDLGAVQAYNLDGGGSSTMVFDGSVVNNPTTNGGEISERAVSDILYIG